VPKYLLFFVAVLWTGLITYFCLIQSSAIPTIEIPNLDKCVHTFFYFVFTFVWFLFFRKQLQIANGFKPLFFSFLLSLIFGIIIEILQEVITTTRQADIFDVFANLTGSILAILTVLICNKLNVLNSILKK
jgi:VanZ family protein